MMVAISVIVLQLLIVAYTSYCKNTHAVATPSVLAMNKFNLFVKAVQQYKHENKNPVLAFSSIPVKHRVLINNTVEYPIGAVVSKIRTNKHMFSKEYFREQLTALNCTDIYQSKRSSSFSTFIYALKEYKLRYRDTLVHRDFVVPYNNASSNSGSNSGSSSISTSGDGGSCDWPMELHGYKLGSMVHSFRNKYRKNVSSNDTMLSDDEMHELLQTGFVFEPRDRNLDLFIIALISYKSIHGHLLMSRDFIIPHELPYPPVLWGAKLGKKLENVRYRGDYIKNNKNMLLQLGLNVDKVGVDDRHFEHIFVALQRFSQVYMHVQVPMNFVVPANRDWPAEIHGLKLGNRVHNIRYRFDFVKDNECSKCKLDSLGFRWKNEN